jgi:hypothetical protein
MQDIARARAPYTRLGQALADMATYVRGACLAQSASWGAL